MSDKSTFFASLSTSKVRQFFSTEVCVSVSICKIQTEVIEIIYALLSSTLFSVKYTSCSIRVSCELAGAYRIIWRSSYNPTELPLAHPKVVHFLCRFCKTWLIGRFTQIFAFVELVFRIFRTFSPHFPVFLLYIGKLCKYFETRQKQLILFTDSF